MRIFTAITNLTSREKILIIIALLLVLMVVPYVLLFSPLISQVAELQSALAGIEENLLRVELLSPKEEELLADLAETTAEIEMLTNDFRGISQQDQLRFFERAEGSSGVKIILIQPGTVEEKEGLVISPLKLVVRGNYQPLRAFLAELEKRKDLSIGWINLMSTPEDDYQMEVLVNFYSIRE